MQGFNTARVLVLDDQLEQAMPVIRALGSLGIAAVYHDGGVGAPLPRKLMGVRVMFVDMVLAEHGANPDDPEQCVKMVANVLNHLIEDTCDPIVVICWTGHEQMTVDFLGELKKAFPRAKIDNVTVAEKSSFSRPEDLDRLKELISKALIAHNPANILFAWEQMVHDAATRTTGALTQLIRRFGGEKPDEWMECGYRTCAALAFAERGSRLVGETEAHAAKALFDALTPLLADRLDHGAIPSDASIEPAIQRLLSTVRSECEQQDKGRKTREQKRQRNVAIKFIEEHLAAELPQEKLKTLPTPPDETDSLLSTDLRAALNTMLHVSSNVAKTEVCPGTVFLAQYGGPNRKKLKEKLSDNFLTWQEVVEDTFVFPSNKLPPDFLFSLIEFSAACDFAQDKTKFQRFIVGFLVPINGLSFARTAGHIRMLGPLLLFNENNPKIDGVYYIVLNAHYVLGIDHQVSSELIPLWRLRTPILSEVTAWISNHISRPGALNIGP